MADETRQIKVSMNETKARRFVFYLDGLSYSFAFAKLATKRIVETLDEVTLRSERGEAAEDLLINALSDAWLIIDMSHRIRELIQQLPGLPKKTPEIQIFIRSTQNAEDLRHHVQHFRNGIPLIPKECKPLWGALSWVSKHNSKTCYMAVTGNLVDGINFSGISYDRHAGSFTSFLRLSAADTDVDLLLIGKSLEALRCRLLKWLDQDSVIKRKNRKTPIFKFSIPDHLANIKNP